VCCGGRSLLCARVKKKGRGGSRRGRCPPSNVYRMVWGWGCQCVGMGVGRCLRRWEGCKGGGCMVS
jgi:hypothetical protein